MLDNKKPLDRFSLIELSNCLQDAASKEEQGLINLIARELTERFYIPYGEMTFEETLESFGYRDITKGKTLSKR